MILVTVGTLKQNFNRLIKEIDQIARTSSQEFLIQIGNSDYEPKNAKFFKFMSKNKIEIHYKEAEFIVAHAGIGSIMTAKRYGKPIILVPRRKMYGEHFDDHQKEISEKFEEIGTKVVWDITNLENAMKSVGDDSLIFNSKNNQLIPKLKDYINDLNSKKA